MKPQFLAYNNYWVPRESQYRVFSIPKKNGGQRVIHAPNSKLKFLQAKLSVLLNDIYEEMENSRVRFPEHCVISHGFKRGYSIVTNASVHRNKRFVFNVDLKEFFPTINFGRVYGYFVKDRNFRLDPKIATLIAQIACHKNELPQGSPCSPVISNLIAHILDVKLNKIASLGRCSYTRYVDDLTFSTNEKNFPPSIGERALCSTGKWKAGNELLERVYRSGFRINPSKTRMQCRDSRQDATGLIVNKKINVKNEYYKNSRAMCSHLFANGYAFSKVNGRPEPISDQSLEGILGFIYHIRRQGGVEFKREQVAFTRLYQQFLDYRAFHGLDKPRIICEGKTDYIYIRNAIKSHRTKYVELIDAAVGAVTAGENPLKVDFFNYTENAAFFQDLSGGTGELNKLLGTFRSRIAQFKTAARFPVIMIVDNDSGSVGFFKHLGNILGCAVNGSQPFYHVYANLYVVPVPKTSSAPAEIEDLFTATTLAEVIGIRQFDRSGKQPDATKWYGKFDFATEVIQKKRASVDFVGFDPLLQAIADSMKDFAKRIR